MTERTPLADRLVARLLQTPWLTRLPIPLYRAGFGWIFGERLVMIEHLGRVSHEPRYGVVEVVERTPNAVRVASGLGERAQWYRNLRANGVAYLSLGRRRRVPAAVRMLDADESRTVLERYARQHPQAWKHLSSAMDYAAGGHAQIPVVEFGPPGRTDDAEPVRGTPRAGYSR
ncbi:nitroreductase family deazaflavin-dependent oxidoreductase [Microbacterium immunditiarum]|uniref:Deazaflavin-dependent oxidoreductase (Nitroreductase family) n=1 Tax=Microbacterium immunditiarum TaxID=337480 RepID=A0A7Y9GR66_9MICO|nr:nitroreductase family deazaflavin-dependent oxidoreductase [Microbacterium immunditiarum]NYE21229.1 deazaflavin-dependent oxidoreductase (nitroreductase family) [Microbacterium immunditiarum]